MTNALETKALGTDVSAAFEEFSRAFEAFKETNDQRLEALEARRPVDILVEEKLARIDAALDETKSRLDRMALDLRRPPLGGPVAPAVDEHKSAFHTYVRTGEASGLKALEEKALSAGSGPDGGYLVPADVEGEVLRRLAAISPIRSLATVRLISGGTYKRAVATAGPATGWVGEQEPRPQTNGPTLAEQTFPAMELYAMPAATQTLLDDAVVDIDAWLAEEVETAFAEQEGVAFVNGNGVNKPKGFLAYERVANANWSWGKIGTISTGAAGAFADEAPADVLLDLVHALKAGYRQNASFIFNRKTQSVIRKMKDEEGRYLWQPPAGPGQHASLLSFPVVEAEDMPDIAADAPAVAFGDFRRGYLVVDRAGVRVLRDPYSAKPYVLFYTTKRVGGGVQDFDAIKLLTFSE
ncbi:phage major capsid protein [Chelatococcus composti]|jgi:phage major capsid protein, HK97 family|uniref:HK97 family phage major capsid protein n=1 Tax=Chelatococcus composti TaxID=1743235 RepID=A0A841KBU2_9HYPH|nr:phage major capsid protein [Chelatococcus composti]MBB6168374.1 HK97 family phage major capsid protein [Chelatococcus composti]MBS7736543.1 phage major capsid protein [Chelatococcus composti]PZN41037.1 MAG: phage major capsid protein [Pseudomonadota bacterium]GGG39532.1 phage capsid protein [Chelatococcus composti]